MEYYNSTLAFGDNEINLQSKISSVVQKNDVYVVLLDYTDTGQENKNQNIVAFDSEGDQKWRISPSPGSDKRDNPYTGLGTENGRVIGYTWKGMAVKIDMDTGSWKQYGLTK